MTPAIISGAPPAEDTVAGGSREGAGAPEQHRPKAPIDRVGDRALGLDMQDGQEDVQHRHDDQCQTEQDTQADNETGG
jgi:hypothetical protein